VDIAGAKARTEACDTLLDGDKIQTERIREHVEGIKVAAEIELVGLVAKVSAIAKIIEAGDAFAVVSAQIDQEEKKVTAAERNINHAERSIRQVDESIRRLQPFPITDSRVEIRPLKWEPNDDK